MPTASTPRCFAIALLALLMPIVATAQTPPHPPEDPLTGHLVPPELLLQHRQAIALRGEQQAAIDRLVREFHGKVGELQWDHRKATASLAELLARVPIDEPAALAQLDAVIETEHRIKRLHMHLLLRLRNLLDETQLKKLQELRGTR